MVRQSSSEKVSPARRPVRTDLLHYSLTSTKVKPELAHANPPVELGTIGQDCLGIFRLRFQSNGPSTI
ncbi:unnamed protein product [Clonostachys rosea]|uniref:Uncharacterized protein n=1 Tax=Bionectria ochroleuca TaxID=29856 RepID=A0ABY6TU59_BIOOC|nr:unnamed protein product [Clonostachys rosea]